MIYVKWQTWRFYVKSSNVTAYILKGLAVSESNGSASKCRKRRTFPLLKLQRLCLPSCETSLKASESQFWSQRPKRTPMNPDGSLSMLKHIPSPAAITPPPPPLHRSSSSTSPRGQDKSLFIAYDVSVRPQDVVLCFVLEGGFAVYFRAEEERLLAHFVGNR